MAELGTAGRAAAWLGGKSWNAAARTTRLSGRIAAPTIAVGAAAGRAGGRAVLGSRGGATAVVGGAALLGVGSAVMDREGPYADHQETIFGDRDAIRYTAQAGIRTALDRSDRWDLPGPNDSYYGQPVDVPGMHARNRSSGATTPVSGDVVFGMYNLRR